MKLLRLEGKVEDYVLFSSIHAVAFEVPPTSPIYYIHNFDIQN